MSLWKELDVGTFPPSYCVFFTVKTRHIAISTQGKGGTTHFNFLIVLIKTGKRLNDTRLIFFCRDKLLKAEILHHFPFLLA